MTDETVTRSALIERERVEMLNLTHSLSYRMIDLHKQLFKVQDHLNFIQNSPSLGNVNDLQVSIAKLRNMLAVSSDFDNALIRLENELHKRHESMTGRGKEK